jgi:hypothetical protein
MFRKKLKEKGQEKRSGKMFSGHYKSLGTAADKEWEKPV